MSNLKQATTQGNNIKFSSASTSNTNISNTNNFYYTGNIRIEENNNNNNTNELHDYMYLCHYKHIIKQVKFALAYM